MVDISIKIAIYVVGIIILWLLGDLFIGIAIFLGAAMLGEKYPAFFIPLLILAVILGWTFSAYYREYIHF